MPIRLPEKTETFQFIAGTHNVERISCTNTDISNTYSGKAKIPNPYADGHLKALNLVFSKLVGKADFPAREPKLLTNLFKSDMALGWLKELNSTMLSPLLGSPIVAQDPNAPQRQFIGIWRQIPAMNTFSVAPHPDIIPRLMHLWLIEIATLDQEVRPYLDQAYGITQSKKIQLEQTAYHASLFISTAQPFTSGCNRLGRLVENALRIHWRLPFKGCSPGLQHDKYIQDLVEYQQKILPIWIQKAKNSDLK